MSADPLFGLDLGELRSVRAKDLLVRFGFGAAISVIAGLSGNLFGAVVGGLLLAFPAILPATLTLLEHDDSNAAAVHDVGGAVLGGVGLTAFAVVAATTFETVPAWAVLALALAGWAAVSLVLYVLRSTGRLPLPDPIRGPRPGAQKAVVGGGRPLPTRAAADPRAPHG
ncbi:hypothetical protein K6U06_18770 [Acidiferrimicrobium sp. IK]|uniref:hypothetical protein n=1 Tax=Acidiferrimicrobium sp. IK TaxID=2871700 RepID=UPI0021CB7363|nr:hypothetical protein [Acidiferrimicrobium sp. IK]MCU4186418.1 hypothetical protein [Acidiferrimicrobium sp. IK]